MRDKILLHLKNYSKRLMKTYPAPYISIFIYTMERVFMNFLNCTNSGQNIK